MDALILFLAGALVSGLVMASLACLRRGMWLYAIERSWVIAEQREELAG